MEELFFRYNPHWEKDEHKESSFVERPDLLNHLTAQIKNKQLIFISGLRRVGKTTLMRMLIDHLIRDQVRPEHIFYISLDNYLLREIDLSDILENYRKIHNLEHDRFVYLFFDEITFLQDYEIQLKNLYDLGHCKIFASASNTSLLKSKKPYLTGRSRIIEIPPLDFGEYLLFKGLSLRRSDDHLTHNYFTDFLKTGGIPEYVLTGDAAYIQDLVDDIIYKDIVAQYQLRNPKILRDFFLLLMERAGKQFSINKMASILGISTERARQYLEYFSDTYLIHLVERAGKTNERLLSPKKIYASDLGIRNFFTGFRDLGALFENYVYLKLRPWQPQYLYEERTEIDFLIHGKYLVEAKYLNAVMTRKQEDLFQRYPAAGRFIVKDHKDIEEVLTVLNKKTSA